VRVNRILLGTRLRIVWAVVVSGWEFAEESGAGSKKDLILVVRSQSVKEGSPVPQRPKTQNSVSAQEPIRPQMDDEAISCFVLRAFVLSCFRFLTRDGREERIRQPGKRREGSKKKVLSQAREGRVKQEQNAGATKYILFPSTLS